MNDLEEIVYKHALLNAAKHKGSANPGAVMGSIMANEPELRSRAKEIGPLAGKIVAQVNNLSKEEQASEMEKYDVEVKEKKKVKEEGITKYLPVKYTLSGWVENMVSYLRSAMSYTDCKDVKEFIGKPDLIVNSISL